MIDIQLIENDTKVRFSKKLWHESEILLAKCFNFHAEASSDVIIADLYTTSMKALMHFIKLSFKNFSEGAHDASRREGFYTRVEAFYQRRNDYVDGIMRKRLPYYDKLYAHQKDVLYESFFKKYNFYAMDMGTGKTICSASMSRIQAIPRTVVLCPASVKFNWFRDLVKFGFNDLYFTMLDSAKRRSFRAFNERFVICNYDILEKFQDEIIGGGVGKFIFDEAQALKNHTTHRFKMVKKIVERCHEAPITFLSGTPITNRVNDVFPYLKLIDHELGHNHKKFLEQYTIRTAGRGGDRVTGGQNLQDLHTKLSNFMIRKTKEECLDLPPKVYLSYKFELDDYREEYDKIINELSEAKEISRLSGNLHSLNIITSKAKKQGIIEIAEGVINEGRKVVIFGSYRDPINDLEKHFGAACVKIDGSVDSFTRDQLVQKFINDPECKYFLANMIAGGVGINLVNASDVIFMNFPFTPAELHQAIDRCNRIGQTRSVNVHLTFCDQSIDEYLHELIVGKEVDINIVIDQGKEVVTRNDTIEILIKKLLKKDDINFKIPHAKAVVMAEEEKVEEVGEGVSASPNGHIESQESFRGDGLQNGLSNRQGEIDNVRGWGNHYTGSVYKGQQPQYHLMYHAESDCMFVFNQEEFDLEPQNIELTCLFSSEIIEEVFSFGYLKTGEGACTFYDKYTPNPDTVSASQFINPPDFL